jgi:Patatin-like phospholipase
MCHSIHGAAMSDYETYTKWVAKERALKDRIRAGGFAIALSGGGHRATLATLGALLAIVDRGLGAKVIQIASVSGGSITNAFVAQRCKFETLQPGELDGIATELAAAVVRKGVLTREWMALLLLSTVVFGAAAATLFRVFVVPWTWLAMAIGLVVALSSLIARGLVVEWLLDRRYFRHSTTGYRPAHRAQLASLSGGDVDHVFCMTDLALGLPVYASSGCGGMMWRRLKVEPSSSDIHERSPFHTFDASKLSIAELVRASAAFPGISPRRLPIPPDPAIDMVSESPRVAFLSDGGLWNNLATHVMREDAFIGTYCDKDSKGVPRPYWEGMHRDIPLLCFNGSALLQPSHPWAFSVPGVALLRSLLQTANILDANTVLPRVAAMQMAFQRRALTRSAERSSEFDPINLVVDLAGVLETARRYSYGFLCDPNPEDISSYDSPIIGRAKLEDQRSLTDSPAWMQAGQEGDGRVDAPTTLDRIDVNLARRLIARAYFNTYLVSLFLAPLFDQEIERLADFEFRVDQILGLRDKSEARPSRSG